MLKIIVSPTAFKESLSASQVAEAITKGIVNMVSHCKIVKLPLADGGDGTIDAISNVSDSITFYVDATGPLWNGIKADLCFIDNYKTAVIETASVAGLKLVPKPKRNPLYTTSYGVGELINIALQAKVKKIYIGLGGSATVDCGIGALSALGVRFLDKAGKALKGCGANLRKVHNIDISHLNKNVGLARLEILSDVTVQLLGEYGAVRLFGPQKGAGPREMAILEEGFEIFVNVAREKLGIDMSRIRCGGSAGGLSAGLSAFLNANIELGAPAIMNLLRLKDHIRGADLIITGEGKIDKGTLLGKTPYYVIKLAKQNKIPSAVICGVCELDKDKLGADYVEEILPKAKGVKKAMESAYSYVTLCAENIIRNLA